MGWVWCFTGCNTPAFSRFTVGGEAGFLFLSSFVVTQKPEGTKSGFLWVQRIVCCRLREFKCFSNLLVKQTQNNENSHLGSGYCEAVVSFFLCVKRFDNFWILFQIFTFLSLCLSIISSWFAVGRCQQHTHHIFSLLHVFIYLVIF